MLLPGEKRRIIVARQGTYKKNTKPCNVQVYNCGSGGVAPPPRRRWQPTQRQRCVPAVYRGAEAIWLWTDSMADVARPSDFLALLLHGWWQLCGGNSSLALAAAQQGKARAVACGGGASPPYFIRWKNMDRDHGAQSQRRSPLAKKRARIVITLPPPPSCRRAAARRARLPAGSGRPEPKRQLETTAEVSGETWSLETLVAPLHAIKGQDWWDLMGRQPTWRSKVCRRVRLERTQPYLPYLPTFLPNLPLPWSI